MSTTIVTTLTMDLHHPNAGPVPVRVMCCYNPTDPFAVTLAFPTSRGGSVEWLFARNLLRQGLFMLAGDGDVRLSPSGGDTDVQLVLDCPNGRAVFSADRRGLAEFLNSTDEVVPPGEEAVGPLAIDWDGMFAPLLADGASS